MKKIIIMLFSFLIMIANILGDEYITHKVVYEKVYIGTAGSNVQAFALNSNGNIEVSAPISTSSSNATYYTPYLLPQQESNDINVAYSYQKAIITNPVAVVYFPSIAAVGSNGSRIIYFELDKGTNSFTFAAINCTTTGVGSINTLVATNTGISSYMFLLPCAGTNLNTTWKGYQL